MGRRGVRSRRRPAAETLFLQPLGAFVTCLPGPSPARVRVKVSCSAPQAATRRTPTAGQRVGGSPTELRRALSPPEGRLVDLAARGGLRRAGLRVWAGGGPSGIAPPSPVGGPTNSTTPWPCRLAYPSPSPLPSAERWWPARSTTPSWRWSTPLPCTSGCASTAAALEPCQGVLP